MRKIIVSLFLIPFTFTISQKYYVDSQNGNDNNLGNSPKQAWQKISKISETKFPPGAEILFKRNGIWREELNIPNSGTNEKPIKISAYGKGSFPKILGSEKIENLINHNESIWKFTTNLELGWLWFVDKNDSIIWGKKVEHFDSLTLANQFLITDSNVFIYSEKNPLIEFESIEASVRDFGIISGWYDEGTDFIELDSLEIMFTKNANIRIIKSNYWKIENIISHHSGATDESDGQGIQIEGKNNLISNCTFYENGQHGIFISSFGNADVMNNRIENNRVYNNYHTGIDLMNDGGNENSHKNTIVARNLIYDLDDFNGKEIGIQTLGYDNGKIKNTIIHHNVVLNLNGMGISVMNNSDSIFVHNNTIINTKSACINVNSNYYTEVINNCGVNKNYYAVFFLRNFKDKVIDYNCWFSNTETTKLVFADDRYYTDLEIFYKETKFDKNSFSKNPIIEFEEGYPYKLNENSPLRAAGKRLNYKKNFFDFEIQNEINIGAL